MTREEQIDIGAKALFRTFVRTTLPTRFSTTEAAAFERRWANLPGRTRRQFRDEAEAVIEAVEAII